MEKAIIGKKVGMTQIFDEAGHVIRSRSLRGGPAPWCRRRPWRRTATAPFSWASGRCRELSSLSWAT